jgi:DNA-binding beta-propeller fold protein YncE
MFILFLISILYPLIFIADLNAQQIVHFKKRFSGQYEDVYVDQTGLMYLLEGKNGTLEIYDNLKLIKAFDISGKDTEHSIDNPSAIAVSNGGSIFIIDKDKNKIFVFDDTGNFKYMFGPSTDDRVNLSKPRSLAFDIFGRLFVADEDIHNIKIYSEQGIFLGIISGIEKPIDLSFDGFGNLYVLEKKLKQVSVLNLEFEVIKKLNAIETRNFSASTPTGVFVEGDGTLYITDEDKSRVRIYNPKIDDPAEVMTYFEFGQKGSGNGEFKKPSGVFVDLQGNIYIVDTDGKNVQVFEIPEVRSGKESSQFARPHKLPITVEQVAEVQDYKAKEPGGLLSFTVDSNNNIYAVNAKDKQVNIYSFDNKLRTSFGKGGSDGGRFKDPQGITWSEKKLVYITDTDNNRVQMLSENGVFLKSFGKKGKEQGQFDKPRDIALDSDGNIYVADFKNDRIQVFTPEGAFVRQISGRNAPIVRPIAVEVDESGKIYVVEEKKDGVRILSSEGNDISKIGIGSEGLVKNPIQIAVDNKRNLYVIDSFNLVQVFDSTGVFIIKFGSPGENFGQFLEPSDINVAESGEIFVSDAMSNKISVFTLKNYSTAAIAGRINPIIDSSKIELIKDEEVKIEKNITTPDGSFFIGEVLSGTYDIVISAPGHVKERIKEKKISATEFVNFGEVALVKFGSLKGTVLPPSSGATVSLIGEAGEILYSSQITSDGSFIFSELRPGNYILQIEADGFIEYESEGEISISSGKRSTVPEVVTLIKRSVIYGLVYPGSSVANVIAKQNGEVIDSTTINPYNGSFKLVNCVSGTYEINITAEGYKKYLAEAVNITTEGEKDLGVIKLEDLIPTPDWVKQYLQEGKQWYAEAEYVKAAKKFDQALKTSELGWEDEIATYIWLAKSYFPLPGNQQKVELLFEEAIKKNPSLELESFGELKQEFIDTFEKVKATFKATIEGAKDFPDSTQR